MNTKICLKCAKTGSVIHGTDWVFSSTDKEFYCPVCKVTYPRSSEKTHTKYVSEDQLKFLIAYRRSTKIENLLG